MKKTILVTGGTGVIGLSIIDLFYKKGFNVIAARISKANSTKVFKKKFSSKRSLTINTELTSSKNVRKVTALETAKDPITCNSLCPGFVLMELIQDQIKAVVKNKNIPFLDARVEMLRDKQPSLKFFRKEDIASMIFFLCSQEADQVTGSNISLDGAWTAH